MGKSPAIHRTPLYRARAAYRNMRARCGNPDGKNPAYAEVELRMTMEEWIAWAVPEYERFDEEHPGAKPSVSRNGDEGHYELGNIELLTLQENRARMKSAHTGYVELVCPGCAEKFVRDKRTWKARTKAGHVQYCSRSCVGKHHGRGM